MHQATTSRTARQAAARLAGAGDCISSAAVSNSAAELGLVSATNSSTFIITK